MHCSAKLAIHVSLSAGGAAFHTHPSSPEMAPNAAHSHDAGIHHQGDREAASGFRGSTEAIQIDGHCR